ncbi:signal recognition particle-docking protein FtsY [Eikenella corrodens]|uniref:Signal recognition particle receptor FtsY n=1 Tax=Eikenella corrodens TaxID=539 RepID=A0A3S9SLU8_EIKCO|nr:signal recognition particle-docking protein FtsY [Eikenella corrodens]AZR60507.1 signal recognition particle-docking protein FtsY [Eikenella corrodens]
MVFGFFRKRKAQPTAPQQDAESVQAVEEAVQTDEVVAQAASETAEQAAAQTPDDAIPAAESESTDLIDEASAHGTASTEAVSAEAAPAPPEILLEPGLAATQTDETANALPTVETAEQAMGGTFAAKAEEAVAFNKCDADEQASNEPASSEPTAAESVAPLSTDIDQAAIEPVSEQPTSLGWAARLKQGLSKSRQQMAKSLAGVFGGGKIDEDLYEELETVLLTSDMGIEATEHLMEEVRQRVSLRGLRDGEELRGALKEAIYELIKPLEQPMVLPADKRPFVIMLAGINGAGKTTSIGKLAKYFQAQGKSVLLAAGDTFRAAAREQLAEWGERNGVTVISQASGDSAAVCFDAVEAAKARGIDIVLADTAGRLPTQTHLMEEIKKVKRVLQKSMPDAPHEIVVVLDANIGQNAVNQVIAFDDALGLTGLIVTKLDGTAKGGVLAALASRRPVPVRFIGVGEGIDDLRPFNAREFVDALL